MHPPHLSNAVGLLSSRKHINQPPFVIWRQGLKHRSQVSDRKARAELPKSRTTAQPQPRVTHRLLGMFAGLILATVNHNEDI
jgi:hypothetical protein